MVRLICCKCNSYLFLYVYKILRFREHLRCSVNFVLFPDGIYRLYGVSFFSNGLPYFNELAR